MGWETLAQWGADVARIEPLAGGVANDMWSVRVGGRLAVGRLGSRSDADLACETELLRHLDRVGLTVPVLIPTVDGRLSADGLVVTTYLEGGPPETPADRRRVAGVLGELHRLKRWEDWLDLACAVDPCRPPNLGWPPNSWVAGELRYQRPATTALLTQCHLA